MRKQLKRSQVIGFFTQLPPCLVGMEACGGAHYWARKLTQLAHTVKLIAPQFVKPYVKTNKNDAADAEAICERLVGPICALYRLRTPNNKRSSDCIVRARDLSPERTAQS